MRTLALVAAVAAGSIAVAQKVPDVRLNTSAQPAFSNGPAIAASGSAVYVTWQDNRNGAPDLIRTVRGAGYSMDLEQ